MSADTVYKNCTLKCERMPNCRVCGNQKKPWGRDHPDPIGYCTNDCEGYNRPPQVGHLWPGELSQIRADEGGTE